MLEGISNIAPKDCVPIQIAAATVSLEVVHEFEPGGRDQFVELGIVAMMAIARRSGAGSE